MTNSIERVIIYYRKGKQPKREGNIIKVVEDFPFITVYYESGVIRKYKSVYEVPATAWYFMNDAKSTVTMTVVKFLLCKGWGIKMLVADKEIVQDMFNLYVETQKQIELINQAVEKLNNEQKALLAVMIYNHEMERLKK